MTTQAIAENPSGSAPETAVEQVAFQDFTASERAEYLKTLKLPERKKDTTQPKTEESAPPEQPEKAAAEPEKAETAPESAPDKESQEKGKKAFKGTPAEDRVKELLADRNARDKRIQELERLLADKVTPKTPESAPDKPQPKGLEAPKKPKLEDFKTYEEYDAAKDAYYEELSEFKAKKAVQEAEQRRAQAEVDRSVAAKLQEAKQLYPDFDDVAVPVVEAFGKGLNPAVVDALGRSQNMAHILYVIGKDAAEVKAFQELAQRDPVGAILKIGIYEQLVKAELDKSRASADKTEKPEVQKSPAKQLTSAPPPPPEVGGKSQVAPDALEQALKDGDVEAYRRELNRQLRARGRG